MDAKTNDIRWRWLYTVGGTAALLAVVLALLEISITFLPGGNVSPQTVGDWFALLQERPFMDLRNLGLLNIMLNGLAIPVFLALYAVHRRVQPGPAALAMALSFIGIAVFFATNRAFPMLDLSQRYTAAATEAQRTALAAAGEALLAVGASHTPGTFLAFFLAELAGIIISVVMLRGGVFSKAAAYAGVLGFALLLVFEVLASFVLALSAVSMALAMVGGLASMTWYVLLGRTLLQLGKG